MFFKRHKERMEEIRRIQTLQAQKTRELSDRIEQLRATLNGESEWFTADGRDSAERRRAMTAYPPVIPKECHDSK